MHKQCEGTSPLPGEWRSMRPTKLFTAAALHRIAGSINPPTLAFACRFPCPPPDAGTLTLDPSPTIRVALHFFLLRLLLLLLSLGCVLLCPCPIPLALLTELLLMLLRRFKEAAVITLGSRVLTTLDRCTVALYQASYVLSFANTTAMGLSQARYALPDSLDPASL